MFKEQFSLRPLRLGGFIYPDNHPVYIKASKNLDNLNHIEYPKGMISPVSDVFVKYLLGREETKDLLLSFINAVLTDSGFTKLVEVTIKNPFNLKSFILDKDSTLDIKASDEAHHIYDIEVQVAGNDMFKNRSLYYWSKLYTSQVLEGDDYKVLKPVICINLLDFELIRKPDKYHNVFWITEKDDPQMLLTNHLQIHFLELPIFRKEAEGLKTKADYWLYYFKHEGKEEKSMRTVLHNDSDIAKAHREYEKFTMDDELRELHEARQKFLMDQRTLINSAREEGLDLGYKQGMEQGIGLGMEQGIEQGMEKNKNAIVSKMRAKGYSLEEIAEITGISLDTLRTLH